VPIPLPIETERLVIRPFVPETDAGEMAAVYCDRWGRGFATEAASACLVLGLAHLGVPRIIAVVDVENEPSMRLPGRIGMTRLGKVEDNGRPHAVFAAWPARSPRP
jgi:RimJ/RimL family protein N-acetyltransferase